MNEIWVVTINTWAVGSSRDYLTAKKIAENQWKRAWPGAGPIEWNRHCGPWVDEEEQCRKQAGGLWAGHTPDGSNVFLKLVPVD